MSDGLQLLQAPELVFGLVAPIGVDLNLVTEVLTDCLLQVEYDVRVVRLTGIMREVPTSVTMRSSPYIESYRDRIAYANEVRSRLGDAALATLAISAIRSSRVEHWRAKMNPTDFAASQPDESFVPKRAYVIRQFKRPEEINLMRSVYGRQFILVSAYAPRELRHQRIEGEHRRSLAGMVTDAQAQAAATELVSTDANEQEREHGQNVQDAFPLGDIFIDATTRSECESALRRFIKLLFGNNQITPTRDEYGMYMAKSASLRSSDLSRQVGAALFRSTGEIATLGSNEVPKAGGGTYWPGDEGDARDFVKGFDPNEHQKLEILVDLVDRLKSGGHLSKQLSRLGTAEEVGRKLLAAEGGRTVRSSKLMDIIEFGRIIHAEMSAVCDAARRGVPVEGGTLYSTAFPCHICAKHIVAAGVKRVVYVEPYPKSYAEKLHDDSIEVETALSDRKVHFQAFIGVSPYRYRDLFEKGRRKYLGVAQTWHKGQRQPMIEVYFPSYFQAERLVVAQLKKKLEALSVTLPQSSETTNPA